MKLLLVEDHQDIAGIIFDFFLKSRDTHLITPATASKAMIWAAKTTTT